MADAHISSDYPFDRCFLIDSSLARIAGSSIHAKLASGHRTCRQPPHSWATDGRRIQCHSWSLSLFTARTPLLGRPDPMWNSSQQIRPYEPLATGPPPPPYVCSPTYAEVALVEHIESDLSLSPGYPSLSMRLETPFCAHTHILHHLNHTGHVISDSLWQ